jgi:hypothetical protein
MAFQRFHDARGMPSSRQGCNSTQTEHSGLISPQRHQLRHRPQSSMYPPTSKGPLPTTQHFGTPSTTRAHPRLREQPGAWAAHHQPTTHFTNPTSTKTSHHRSNTPPPPSSLIEGERPFSRPNHHRPKARALRGEPSVHQLSSATPPASTHHQPLQPTRATRPTPPHASPQQAATSAAAVKKHGGDVSCPHTEAPSYNDASLHLHFLLHHSNLHLSQMWHTYGDAMFFSRSLLREARSIFMASIHRIPPSKFAFLQCHQLRRYCWALGLPWNGNSSPAAMVTTIVNFREATGPRREPVQQAPASQPTAPAPTYAPSAPTPASILHTQKETALVRELIPAITAVKEDLRKLSEFLKIQRPSPPLVPANPSTASKATSFVAPPLQEAFNKPPHDAAKPPTTIPASPPALHLTTMSYEKIISALAKGLFFTSPARTCIRVLTRFGRGRSPPARTFSLEEVA